MQSVHVCLSCQFSTGSKTQHGSLTLVSVQSAHVQACDDSAPHTAKHSMATRQSSIFFAEKRFQVRHSMAQIGFPNDTTARIGLLSVCVCTTLAHERRGVTPHMTMVAMTYLAT